MFLICSIVFFEIMFPATDVVGNIITTTIFFTVSP